MRIETGTTNERLGRCGVLALALWVFAGWFTVDGWYRYPRKALEMLQKDIKLEKLPTPNPKLAYKYPEEPRLKYAEDVRKGWTKAEVLADLGEPVKIQADPALKTDHWHYVGQYGRLALEVQRTGDLRSGRVLKADWEQTPADYRYESIQQQKFFAISCVVLGSVGVVWLIKIWRTRVIVDERGLTYDRLAIPWDAMVDLDSSEYHEKGWVRLIYASGAKQRRIKLDSFKIGAYDDVIDAICEKKGFANPIPVDVVGDEAPDQLAGESDPQAPIEQEERP
jgi:hypothetical protein